VSDKGDDKSSTRKAWVLDTETKGTGAQMVPLDKIGGGAGARGAIVVKPPRPIPEKKPEPRRPRLFKVVDVMTRQTLVEDAGVRETLDLLRGMRSVVDVSVYVRKDRDGDWRRLSQREQRILWEGRKR
jgi:hypothetical protein